jgi:citrate lyase beta subunit
VHVVYGGADRYSADTPQKLGEIALKTLRTYAPNFVEFAKAFYLPGSETLPDFPEAVAKLEKQIARNHSKAKAEDHAAWFAWTVYQKTLTKLESEPVEDFRIDFEDGYGFRTDEEEDRDAVRAAEQLASAYQSGSITAFSGLRIKSLNKATSGRGLKTLDLFLKTLIEKTGGPIPDNFVVTLPKITDKKQVGELCDRLKKFEKRNELKSRSIGVELMIESPLALFDRKGKTVLTKLVNAADGRCTSAHFGAFDYTSALGIVSSQQGLHHPSCEYARQMMLANLAPLGIRLADSVTTRLPVTIHKNGKLSTVQTEENRFSIYEGWREHFVNVTTSMKNGFYQSWDLHPNQLPARYAAVYSFFLSECDAMAARLKDFLGKATKATLTGNTFDDAASVEGILNFFRRGSDCGAFDAKEIKALLGMTVDELNSASCQEIAAKDMSRRPSRRRMRQVQRSLDASTPDPRS